MSLALRKTELATRPVNKKIAAATQPTGHERRFHDDEIIVSKTNLKGHITYVNRVFMRLAGMSERELLGAPHSIIRHPDMPRCVFKLLWETLEARKEIFAYVINMAKNGDHYWVFAHVTPSFGPGGEVLGYHSNRRTADRRVLSDTIMPLYKALCAEERSQPDRKTGLAQSYATIQNLLEEKGLSYEQLVFSL